MFLSQLTNIDGNKLLTWDALKLKKDFEKSKKEPKWFKKLKSIILEKENQSTLMKEKYRVPTDRYYDHNIKEVNINDNRKKEWLITWLPDIKQIFVGQILIKDNNTETVIVQHYGLISGQKDISPNLQTWQLNKCTGENDTNICIHNNTLKITRRIRKKDINKIINCHCLRRIDIKAAFVFDIQIDKSGNKITKQYGYLKELAKQVYLASIDCDTEWQVQELKIEELKLEFRKQGIIKYIDSCST